MAKTLIDQMEIEYVDGRPYRKVSPKRVHSMVQLALAMLLKRCAGKQGSVGPEWCFRLSPGNELIPDVAYVSYERLRPLTNEEADEPPFAPDIAAEVRSPSRRSELAAEKIGKYLTHGSLLVLDIDPEECILYVHTQEGGVTAYRSGESFSNAIIPWLQFNVDELFIDLEIPR